LLLPARLHSMDGNSSLKRVEGSGSADQCTFHSHYHILPSEVDKFKDEVKSRWKNKLPSCVGNWKAASNFSEETVKVFEQTGIFVSAC
jgi:hypothetical protein